MSGGRPLRFRAGGRTEGGPNPHQLEPVDYLLLDPHLGLFLVLDAGGSWSELRHRSGRTGAEAIQRVATEGLAAGTDPRALTERAFQIAGEALRAEVDENGWHGAASVVLALLHDEQMHVAWLGDAMAYRVTGGQIEPLTRPHTVWNEMVRRGTINETNAATANPNFRLIHLYSLGNPELPNPPEVVSFAPLLGDRVILATDGITDHLTPDIIRNACRVISDPTTCAEAIIEHALMAGSRQNCTCAVVAFEQTGDSPPEPPRPPRKWWRFWR